MNINDIEIGRRVRTLQAWVLVPEGTEGVIVEDYGSGIIVQWDIPNQWRAIRDGFDKATEIQFLEVVR